MDGWIIIYVYEVFIGNVNYGIGIIFRSSWYYSCILKIYRFLIFGKEESCFVKCVIVYCDFFLFWREEIIFEIYLVSFICGINVFRLVDGKVIFKSIFLECCVVVVYVYSISD